MRRVIGPVVLALGAFLLVLAVLLPTYVASALIRVDLDQYSKTVSEAEGATIFDPGTLSQRTDVDLQATRVVRGDVKASTRDRVVFDVFVRVADEDGKDVTLASDRVALDRRTGRAVNCCGENVSGKPVRHTGQAYKFPFGTEKTSYPYFDNTAGRAFAARYVSSERIHGLTVYKFVMTIEPVKIAEVEVPGSLVGAAEPTVRADRYYSNVRTLWVEPRSGQIVRGEEVQLQTLRDEQGLDKLTLFDATLAFTDDTVRRQAAAARDNARKIVLVTTVLPVVAGLLGVLLLTLGGFLVARRRATTAAAAGAPGADPAGGAPTGRRPAGDHTTVTLPTAGPLPGEGPAGGGPPGGRPGAAEPPTVETPQPQRGTAAGPGAPRRRPPGPGAGNG